MEEQDSCDIDLDLVLSGLVTCITGPIKDGRLILLVSLSHPYWATLLRRPSNGAVLDHSNGYGVLPSSGQFANQEPSQADHDRSDSNVAAHVKDPLNSCCSREAASAELFASGDSNRKCGGEPIDCSVDPTLNSPILHSNTTPEDGGNPPRQTREVSTNPPSGKLSQAAKSLANLKSHQHSGSEDYECLCSDTGNNTSEAVRGTDLNDMYLDKNATTGETSVDLSSVERTSIAQLSTEYTTTNLRSIVSASSPPLSFHNTQPSAETSPLTTTSPNLNAGHHTPDSLMTSNDSNGRKSTGTNCVRQILGQSTVGSGDGQVGVIAETLVSQRLAKCLDNLRSATSRFMQIKEFYILVDAKKSTLPVLEHTIKSIQIRQLSDYATRIIFLVDHFSETLLEHCCSYQSLLQLNCKQETKNNVKISTITDVDQLQLAHQISTDVNHVSHLANLEKIGLLRIFRKIKLEKCLAFCERVTSHLESYVPLADNLTALRLQREQFDNFISSNETTLKASREFISDAQLDSSTDCNLNEKLDDLERDVGQLTSTMDDTEHCYSMLEKTHEYAINTMKCVVSLKVQRPLSDAELADIKSRLKNFTDKHPTISQSTLVKMTTLAAKLSTSSLHKPATVERLKRQCNNASNKYRLALERLHETEQLVIPPSAIPSQGLSVTQPATSSRHGSVNAQCSVTLPRSRPLLHQAQRYRDGYRHSTSVDNPQSAQPATRTAASPASHHNASLPHSRHGSLNTRALPRSTSTPLHFDPGLQARGLGDSSCPCHSSDSVDSYTTADGSSTSSCEMYTPPRYVSLTRRDQLQSCGSCNSLPMRFRSPRRHRQVTSDLSLTSSDFSPECMPPWSPLTSANSHLMATDAAVSSSMSYLPQQKDIKNIDRLLYELLKTEVDYIRSLRYVRKHYYEQIDSRNCVPESLRGKNSIIFGNIEQIRTFHEQSFLTELRRSVAINPYHVAQCFLKYEAEFHLYSLYNKNKPKSDKLMAEGAGEFFKLKQRELDEKLDLSSYLLKPTQRVVKYSMLLRQLLKECSISRPEYKDLKMALDMTNFHLRHGDDLLAMDCVTRHDVNLQEQGMLLRRGEFTLVRPSYRLTSNSSRTSRHIFLFEKMLVFTKTKHHRSGPDTYQYKNCIKTSELGLTERVEDNVLQFDLWFRKRLSGETYRLQAKSSSQRMIFVQEVSQLLWSQAIANRGKHLTHMAKMGIGWKPCMSIKTSRDNISDRFIDVSKSRIRKPNSSFEHLSLPTATSIADLPVSPLASPSNTIPLYNIYSLDRPKSIISNLDNSSGYSSMQGGITDCSTYRPAFLDINDTINLQKSNGKSSVRRISNDKGNAVPRSKTMEILREDTLNSDLQTSVALSYATVSWV